jgi:microcystin-dependent protein
MSEPFIAEVRIFAGNFAPRGWAFCDGQLLPVAQNTALFSLIGTVYGGDGRTTTALPNLKGRAPMHPGRGPGLTSRRLGQRGGVETVTLTTEQIPQHTHAAMAVNAQGATNQPAPTTAPAQLPGRGSNLYSTGSPDGALRELANTGGGQAHDNMEPYLTLNFIIALVGLYPSRS